MDEPDNKAARDSVQYGLIQLARRAGSDEFQANRFARELASAAKYVEAPDGGRRVVIELDGRQFTAADAVNYAKTLPGYKSFFESRVPKATPPAPIDVATLTPDQYRELRKSNPEKLGLRKLYVNQKSR